jgi:DNA-binding SARP family transcriptional activator
MALLWPEFDAARARNNFKQLVFSVRAMFAPDVLLREGATLRLNGAVVAVDLWEFHDALAHDARREAVALHTGPFLDGFFIPGLTELSRWIETERERLSGLCTTALRRLARGAESDEAAVPWWRALVALNPTSEICALGLIRALAGAGDVGEALEAARSHVSVLRTEFELEPSLALRELTKELQSRIASPSAAQSLRYTVAEAPELTGQRSD